MIEEKIKGALVSEEKQPYRIPNNWNWTYLGYLVSVRTGKKDANHGTHDGEYPFFTCASEPIKSPTFSFEGESIILPGNGANVGLCLYYDGKFEAYQRTYILNNFKGYLKYLYFNLLFDWKRYNSNKQFGSATNYIKLSNITEYPIPLPPLNEQKRIVDKVERLLDKINQAKQLIEESKESFELRRAAILYKAFRGELTVNWRELNPNVGTAEDFILKVHNLEEKNVKKKANKSIVHEPFKLPKSWKWVRLEELIQHSSYGTSSKTNDDPNGIPVLRMGNIVDGRLDLTNLKYLPADHEDIQKLKIEENDLLFNRTNSYELVGKTAIVSKEIAGKMTYASYLVNVRLYYKEILAQYICYYINSFLGRNYLLSMVTQQVGQANINATKLASLVIPLPSEEEIVEITGMINSMFEKERRVLEYIDSQAQAESLTTAILQKAFRGELGTNDPTEASSINLLQQLIM